MPSHAELRRAAEWGLRVVVIVALATALWRTLRGSASEGRDTVRIAASSFDRDIRRHLAGGSTGAIDFVADAAPTAGQRDLLRASRRAGLAVDWRGDVPSLALHVTREREPFADGRIMSVSDGKGALALADSAGPIDTVRSRAATVEVGTLVGTVRASRDGFAARAGVPAPESRRAVLVLGRVGWEVKFVMAALVESGWTVRSSSPAAPTVTVRDDGILPLDTTRYDAVIALDSTATEFAGPIARFVTQGGGLVAVGTALEFASVRGVAPAGAGVRTPGRILLTDDTATMRDLPLRALVNIRNDAVTLGREPQGVVLAARRVGAARVLAVGYDETWRWRMLGGESGLPRHREWWSHAAGAVAPSHESGARAQDGDAAPRAALVDALGPPSADKPSTSTTTSNPLPLVLLALLVIALVAETASRRLRGVP